MASQFAFGNDKAAHTETSTEASQFAFGNDKAATTEASTETSQFAFDDDKSAHTFAAIPTLHSNHSFAFNSCMIKWARSPALTHIGPSAG